MSELTSKFLAQLKQDIPLMAQDAGLAGTKLMALSQRIEVSEERDDVPLSLDQDQGRLFLQIKHPAVAHLLSNPHRRRSDLLFIASSMMSILNREEEDITDEHEREFHARILRFALEEGQGSWAGIA
jgi:hypothetical protein